MSSPLFAPAVGRPVAFVPKPGPKLFWEHISALPKLSGVAPASRLEVRPAPAMVSSGVAEIDALTGGLPRGCLTEICGPASSGRTGVLLAALAAATQRQEACALVDTTDAFDPLSGAAAGVDFERLLWVRCAEISPARHAKNNRKDKEGPVEQVLRVTDLLLQSGGFGMVAIDLSDVSTRNAQRIPLTSWFRFQRVVENTSTILLVIAQVPCAQTCASLLLKFEARHQISAVDSPKKNQPSHSHILQGLKVQGELLRSRLERKPSQSVKAAFSTHAVRAG
jgi:hypothetical protein